MREFLSPRRAMSVVDSVPYGPERLPWRETISEIALSKDGKFLVSPPSADPLSLYPAVPGTTSHLYQVPSSGLTPEQQESAFREALAHLSAENDLLLSSQGDPNIDCNPIKEYITERMLLGGGDPFVDGPCGYNLKWMERSVLDLLASIWHAKWPHHPGDPDCYWGNIMSLDTTEGAYFCLRNARDYLAGKFIDQSYDVSVDTGETDPRPIDVYSQGKYDSDNPNSYQPIVFFTSEAHRSFAKAAHTVNIPTFHSVGSAIYPDQCPLGSSDWPHYVPCAGGDAGPGTVDVEALAKLVDFFSGKGHPVVVIFNCGSHFKGACDDVKRAGQELVPILKKNGMYERNLEVRNGVQVTRSGFWFHVDGVMSAFYLPFLEMAHAKGLTEEKPGPVFDFRLDCVTSLAANFHTWGGSPWHCAVYMTQSRYQLRKTMDHYGFFDTVLTGARNIFSTIVLWTHFARVGFAGQVKRVTESLATARDIEKEFKKLELEVGVDLWVAREPYSFVVRFRKPCREVVDKYHLATRSLFIDGQLREYVQLCRMDRERAEALLQDLRRPNAF